MAQVLITESYLDDIADAIREKNGSEDTYTPAQMAGAIADIQTADEVVLVSKSVTANGTYNPASDSADGYSGVTVNVPNTYTESDEGKVVSSGNLVSQSSKLITQNGTHDTTMNNSVSVDVPNSYSASDNGKVVVNQALTDQTSKSINSNGTHDTTANNSVVVDVPNSYAAADEGKVVSSGELVAQTSRNVTVNGTYDTTTNNEVVVNVSGGGGGGEYSLSLAEYLQFYGTSPGQIIGLPYTVSSDYEIEVDFEVTETSSNNSVIGNSNGYNKPHLTVYNNKWYTSTGGNDLNFGNSSMLTGRHTVVINKNGNSVLFDEQVVLSNLSSNSYQDVYLWVGGRYSSSPGYTLAKAKIYEYKITSISTGNVICDLKPAEIKKNNNAVINGLYDVINDVFYT